MFTVMPPPGRAADLIRHLTQIRERLERELVPEGTIPSALPPFERWSDAADLLSLDGENFVRQAYIRLLGRLPEPAGLRYHDRRLREGSTSKEEILLALHRSPEGRQQNASITGLEAARKKQQFTGDPEDHATFISATGRFYNGIAPSSDSLERWVALLASGSITRSEVIRLFAVSTAGGRARTLSSISDELSSLASVVTDVRNEIEWHQKALEALLSRQA